MSHTLEIQPVSRPVIGSIRPPGSKSLTNRALVLAALAQGPTTLTGVLDSVDTQVMIESLKRLGLPIKQDLVAKTITLTGCGGKLGASPLAPSPSPWGDNELSRSYETALLRFQQHGDLSGEANCTLSLGDISFRRSDHDAAEQWYEKAKQLYQRISSEQGKANCILRLGDVALRRSDYEAALQLYVSALDCYEQLQDLQGSANCALRLGAISLQNDYRHRARIWYQFAFKHFQEVGSVRGMANSILKWQKSARSKSADQKAVREWREAVLKSYKESGVLGETSCIKSLGSGEPLASATELWLENSGTSIRFLTAMCCIGHGRFRLDGNARMRDRPIAPLVAALKEAGVDIRCDLATEGPSVVIEARGLPGGSWAVDGNLSSQYLSALLMTAPCAKSDVTLRVRGELVSRPYVDMTIANMRQFGAEVTEPSPNVFQITARPYRGCHYDIEPDASAASYFFALAAVTGGDITVQGLTRDALQGDVAFVDALFRMGCQVEYQTNSIRVIGGPLRGIDIDMNAISDTAQTLACVAPFATGPTRIRNVAHMRLKETDRVAAVVTELRKLGLTVYEHDDGMTIHPGQLHGGTVATYDDHRMAMSFSLLGLRQPGIVIADPGCTAKTYPEYFADLETLCQAAR